MAGPESFRRNFASRSGELLGLDDKLGTVADSRCGRRNRLHSLHGDHASEPAEQQAAGPLLLLTLGFTLIELLIVIAILGSLAAIAIPNYNQHIQKARTTKIISEMKLLEKEIIIYSMDNDELPDSLADIGRAGFLDPWGNPYRYLNIPKAKGNGKKRKDRFLVPINSDFDLYSMGPDGKTASPLTSKNSYDDIIRGSDGAYFGVASGY